MQLTKGAGIIELMGLQKETITDGILVLRPLLDYTKEQLLEYLYQHNIKYFIDKTNFDTKYKRNYFRTNFADELIKQYSRGIKNSFNYLQNDMKSLLDTTQQYSFKELTLYKYNGDYNIAIRLIDKDLKSRGILISKKSRDEIIKQKNIVISHNIAISLLDDKIYIAPYIKAIMDKKFKERCRKAKIPINIRGYLYTYDLLDLLTI